MNKTLNTIVFLLIATLVLVGLSLAVFLVPLAVFYAQVLPNLAPESEGIKTIVFVVLLILAFVIPFMVYNLFIKIFSRKVDMHKHFLPFLAQKPTAKEAAAKEAAKSGSTPKHG